MSKKYKYKLSLFLISIFCVLSYFFIDLELAKYIKENLPRKWDGFFRVITDLGLAGHWYVLAILGIVISFTIKKRTKNISLRNKAKLYFNKFNFMFFSMLASGVIVNIVKPLIGRFRPRYFFTEELYGIRPLNFISKMNSFPSGHSQAIWSAVISLYIILPRHVLMYFTLGILVSMSRFMINVHYLSDVMMGSYIGIIMPILIKEYYFDKKEIKI